MKVCLLRWRGACRVSQVTAKPSVQCTTVIHQKLPKHALDPDTLGSFTRSELRHLPARGWKKRCPISIAEPRLDLLWSQTQVRLGREIGGGRTSRKQLWLLLELQSSEVCLVFCAAEVPHRSIWSGSCQINSEAFVKPQTHCMRREPRCTEDVCILISCSLMSKTPTLLDMRLPRTVLLSASLRVTQLLGLLPTLRDALQQLFQVHPRRRTVFSHLAVLRIAHACCCLLQRPFFLQLADADFQHLVLKLMKIIQLVSDRHLLP